GGQRRQGQREREAFHEIPLIFGRRCFAGIKASASFRGKGGGKGNPLLGGILSFLEYCTEWKDEISTQRRAPGGHGPCGLRRSARQSRPPALCQRARRRHCRAAPDHRRGQL